MMGRFADNMFADLQAGVAAFAVGELYRGGARKIVDHTGQQIGHVENIKDQDRIASLWAAAPLLLASLEEAVKLYGQPGGPWSVPSDPGGWLENARNAIAQARR